MAVRQQAVDSDGRQWVVQRRWLPHREGRGLRARLARRKTKVLEQLDVFDVPDGCGDELAAVAIVIGVIAALIVAITLGWPLILLITDLIWLTLVLIGGVAARFVLGHPWQVEAVCDSAGIRRRFGVRGYRAAGRLRDDIAERIRRNLPLPTENELRPADAPPA